MNAKKFEQKAKELLEKYGYFVVDTGLSVIYANGYMLDGESLYSKLLLFWNRDQIAEMFLLDVDSVGIDTEVKKNE